MTALEHPLTDDVVTIKPFHPSDMLIHPENMVPAEHVWTVRRQ